MYKKLSHLLALTIFIMSNAIANGLSPEQVKGLEISGIKLGMIKDEAIKGLINKYDTSQDQLEITESDKVNDITGKNEVKHIVYNGDGEAVTIEFDIDVNQTPPQNVVFSVKYAITYSPENSEAIENTLKKRYGDKPVSGRGSIVAWCEEERLRSCKIGMPRLEFNKNPIFIKLSTDQYRRSREAFEIKQKQINKTANF